MRRIDFKPDTLCDSDKDWWDAWSIRAKDATEKITDAVNQGEKIKFNDSVWKDLKVWLLEKVFYGKCSYCESRVEDTDFGDAEHYRPKSKVTIKLNGKECEVMKGNKPHPGYYWLAYDWENLLPACGKCNSGSGKMNQFPANNYVYKPEDAIGTEALDKYEEPFLLHPYRHEPLDYLQFQEGGIVVARDGARIGQTSINVYDLQRGRLVESRNEYMVCAWRDFCDQLKTGNPQKLIDELLEGKKPFSAASLSYIKEQYEILKNTICYKKEKVNYLPHGYF